MFPDNLISLTEDPTLPDLLPENTLLNEFRFDDFTTPLFQSDIVEINRKIEQLTIDLNTQGLRLEIERVKRQRLQTSLRQIKHDLTLPCPELMTLRDELIQMRDYQNTLNYQLDNENAKTNTLSFRSLSRICQIFAELIPSITLSPSSSPEIQTLLMELTNTINHFGVHYSASYV